MTSKDSGSRLRIFSLLSILSLILGQTRALDKSPSGSRSFHDPSISDIMGGRESGMRALEENFREQCSMGESLLRCYVQLSHVNPQLKRDFMAHLGHVCQHNTDHISCFYHYLNNMLYPNLYGNGDNAHDKHPLQVQSTNAFTKRAHRNANYMLCPAAMDTILCFDNYMVLWLNMVTSKEGKRTFGPGKRSVSIRDQKRGKEEEEGEVEGLGNGNVARNILFKDCLHADDFRQCHGAKMKDIMDAIKTKRNVQSVCQDRDPIICFEHYMEQLARSAGSKQKIKGFVGKRGPSVY